MKEAFYPFLMERMMSEFEQTVDYNLSESGVHPLTLRELLGNQDETLNELLSTSLNYPHVNGIPPLREHIAALYSSAAPSNVLVTVGAIEANYATIRSLLEPADEVVVMLPNYMQIWGISKNHNLNVKTFSLVEERDWAPDLDELHEVVTEKTKLIAVCNPNNPTGAVLSLSEIDQIVTVAEKVGAWILADEVYRGAERLLEESPSFWGRYDRVVAVGSMSKAYGLPGLRLGWAVAPVDTVNQIWARHEYITLSATILSNKLAAIALSPKVRPRILDRTRGYIQSGYEVLESWVSQQGGVLSCRPPKASAIAFMRYHFEFNSSQLAERLRTEKSVLVVPGDHFGLDRFLRISFGLPAAYLTAALDRLADLLAAL